MGYRQALLVRWSRRDRLAVLVVAVTVAFLTGATVLLFAVGAQTASVAAEFDSPGSIEYAEGVPEAGPGELVLPVAVVASNRSAETQRLVGIPAGATINGTRALWNGGGTTFGLAPDQRVEQLRGTSGSVTAMVTPRNPQQSVFAPSWYVTDTETARTLGASHAFVIDTRAATDSSQGAPLLGALAFFILGTREAVGMLGATATGAALLVAVTIYSVSRMSVRDRLATIQVVRATGGSPGTVLSIFALRAGLLTTMGVALGYAIGVIMANSAVNVAVAVGLPTALPVSVTGEVVRVLGPLYVGLGGIGLLAGLVAAYPVATCPPGAVTGRTTPASGSWLPKWASLEVLSWRTLVPTTATLTTFVVFVVLVAGIAGAAGPVFASDDVTITEPGSTHPINSKVPATYAMALEQQDIDASAEILLFEAVEGQPFPARGAEFSAFANLTAADLIAGDSPTATDEAVIGRGLARTLDVGVGDTLTLGGSTRSGVAHVELVGVFSAAGSSDDQLILSLATARHLAGVRAGVVQFVRAERVPTVDGESGTGVDVTSVSPDGVVIAGETFNAEATVRNYGLAEEAVDVTLRYGDQRAQRSVSVPPMSTRQVTATFTAGEPGTTPLTAGDVTTSVTVSPPDAIALAGLPSEIPAGTEPRVSVVDATGAGVEGATLTVGNTTRQTRGDGGVRVPPLEAGTYTVTVEADTRSTATSVRVSEAGAIAPSLTTTVVPSTPSLLDKPTIQVQLANPWNQTLVRAVRVTSGDTTAGRTVRLAPGERTRVDVGVPRRSSGTYEVEISLNGSQAATTEYRVTGDERIVAALASSGRAGSSGVGQAVEAAFGNLQVVFGALLGLAALMTIGGTTAAFAGAVHARRQTLGIYRATGAPPLRVLRLVLWDVTRLGLLGAIAAAGLAQAGLLLLGRLGYLTAFGVRLSPTLDIGSVIATILGGLALTLLGAGLATVGVLAVAPSALLAPAEAPTGGETDG
jgi:ABC-type lipoprotein release transport system permease subunit